jgi:hypothetical protein
VTNVVLLILALYFLYLWLVLRGPGCFICGGRDKECNCGRKHTR